MDEKQDALRQKVIEKTILMIEKIANAKDEKTILSDGQEFYRGESHLLKIIAVRPGIYSSEAARCFQVTRAVIHKTLKKLEERGLVEKKQDEKNKKCYRLYVTDIGMKASKELEEIQLKKASVFFDCIKELSQDELVGVIRFLDRSNQVLDQKQ